MPWRQSEESERTYEGYEVAVEEVDAASRFLRSLDIRVGSGDVRLDVALLSPYRKQTQLLAEKIDGRSSNRQSWMTEEPSRNPVVHTVDSFQGNQADIVIVSLVRNNLLPIGRGLGFLDESQRMNVLFSRAERLLVLIGSWDFFCHQLAETPPDWNRYLGHWRIALQYIEECYSNGSAVRIPVGQLQELGT